MYNELEKEYSQKRYRQILDETQEIAEYNLSLTADSDESDIWVSIISQINDIRERIIDKQLLYDWEEIYDRFSIGSIGLEYFDDNDEMRLRLCDIFHGAVHYKELETTEHLQQ